MSETKTTSILMRHATVGHPCEPPEGRWKSTARATGFMPEFGWIEPDVFDGDGYPVHRRGVAEVPGLYFLGLPFLHSPTSAMIRGVGKDARHIAEAVSPTDGKRRFSKAIPG